MEKILSQIILYVEKTFPMQDICTFRTNNSESLSDIWFTYYFYDSNNIENYIKNGLRMTIRDINMNQIESIILSDNPLIIEEAFLNDIPCAAILIDGQQMMNFSYGKYCLSDFSEITVETITRIWQRYNGIPWEICKTSRMLIREQTIDDLDDIVNMYDDPATTMYMEGLYEDRAMEESYMKDYIENQYSFFEYGIWTLIDRESGCYVGRAGLSQREGYDEVELGYVITKSFRKSGYAKEACEAILDYAKDELLLQSVIAFTLNENKPSAGLLLALGFEREGSHIINGKPHDLYRKFL